MRLQSCQQIIQGSRHKEIIGIEKKDEFPKRMAQPLIASGGNAGIRLSDDTETWIPSRHFLGNFWSSICRPIINNKSFPLLVCLCNNGAACFLKIRIDIIGWNYYGYHIYINDMGFLCVVSTLTWLFHYTIVPPSSSRRSRLCRIKRFL